MTHPFHPLHGREFPLVEIKSTMGVERVHYTADDGVVCSIRQGWTSVACEDPFVRVGSGRSAFRVTKGEAAGPTPAKVSEALSIRQGLTLPILRTG